MIPNRLSTIDIIDLGTMPYRDAWAEQERIHAEVVAGAPERILLVEHPPVITFGRRSAILIEQKNEARPNLVADQSQLNRLGVEVVLSDRGGDITFHGPGQLVVYPIIRISDHALSVGGYVRMLELATIETLREIGIEARREAGTVGVWTDAGKIAAIGVRVRRGTTLHGLALNVETNLDYFNLIVPCGLAGRSVTSIRKQLGDQTPNMARMKSIIVQRLTQSLMNAT